MTGTTTWVAIVAEYHGTEWYAMGMAVLSKEDTFDAEKGREVARGRAIHSICNDIRSTEEAAEQVAQKFEQMSISDLLDEVLKSLQEGKVQTVNVPGVGFGIFG